MNLPILGVGLTYFLGIESILKSNSDIVNLLEIEPQSLWYHTNDKHEPYRIDKTVMDRIKSFPCAKTIHSVGLPVGGSCVPDKTQVQLLSEMASDLDVSWMSEHLSFNEATGPKGPFKTGFLLPPRQTQSGVECAVRSIMSVTEHIHVPFAVETGVNYLRPRDDELPDGEFISRVVETADCWLLLDLHNIWTNEINGRQPVNEFLDQIPLERVLEIHLAGGSEYDGYRLDSHSDAIPEPLQEITRRIIPRLPNLRALVFEIFPSFLPSMGLDLVRSQLKIMHKLWEMRPSNSCDQHKIARQNMIKQAYSSPTPQEWEYVLGSLVIGHKVNGFLAQELSADPGIIIMQKLIGSFRSSMLSSTLRLTTRLLMLSSNTSLLDKLMSDYWREFPPQLFASDEARGFADYLKLQNLDIKYLNEILEYELALLDVLINQKNRIVRFEHDPVPLIRALADGQLPKFSSKGDFEIEITSDFNETNAQNSDHLQSTPWHH